MGSSSARQRRRSSALPTPPHHAASDSAPPPVASAPLHHARSGGPRRQLCPMAPPTTLVGCAIDSAPGASRLLTACTCSRAASASMDVEPCLDDALGHSFCYAAAATANAHSLSFRHASPVPRSPPTASPPSAVAPERTRREEKRKRKETFMWAHGQPVNLFPVEGAAVQGIRDPDPRPADASSTPSSSSAAAGRRQRSGPYSSPRRSSPCRSRASSCERSTPSVEVPLPSLLF
uniref:Uncharacterized protein n=1 Tax=Oryza rufipogon TaxID=4529 RepID=A0A0E0ND50_ORYRU